ncbi:MAG: hypothetical protein DCF12_05890 [Snowella sp.]|jgi:hypothetical protein|nr:MAG: hypothetical protein DCF12_05890 [Snowella sp.]
MNKLFSLSVIPLAATVSVASTMFATAPVQAFSLTGLLTFVGDATFDRGTDGVLGGNDDSLKINKLSIDSSSTGSFSGWVNNNGSPLIVSLSDTFSNILGTTGANAQAYKATLSSPITFSNGIKFQTNNPFPAFAQDVIPNVIAFQWMIFDGEFIDPSNNTFLGQGALSAQQILFSKEQTNTYSGTIAPVPEPLTIIGSGIALGFGGFLKRKQKAAEKKS